jgi:3-oxoadipate enol-lactonase
MSMRETTGTITTTAGVDIYYRMTGDGPPMVLVAGLGDDHASWAAQTEAFSTDHTVVAFDNRGIGRSSTPPGPYTIEQMADDAHELARALDLDPVVAAGSSMGGAICQRWALRHPDDIDRLVLTNTWAERDPFVGALVDHWISLARAGGGRHIIESLLVFCFCPDFMARNPETVQEFLAFPPPQLEGFMAAAAACRAHHTLEELSQIHHPALVIAGEHDILTRPQLSRHLADCLSDARLASLPTGHMVFWEMPEAFNALVRGFVGAG